MKRQDYDQVIACLLWMAASSLVTNETVGLNCQTVPARSVLFVDAVLRSPLAASSVPSWRGMRLTAALSVVLGLFITAMARFSVTLNTYKTYSVQLAR